MKSITNTPTNASYFNVRIAFTQIKLEISFRKAAHTSGVD